MVLQSTNDRLREMRSVRKEDLQIKWNQSWHLAGLRIYTGDVRSERGNLFTCSVSASNVIGYTTPVLGEGLSGADPAVSEDRIPKGGTFK